MERLNFDSDEKSTSWSRRGPSRQGVPYVYNSFREEVFAHRIHTPRLV